MLSQLVMSKSVIISKIFQIQTDIYNTEFDSEETWRKLRYSALKSGTRIAYMLLDTIVMTHLVSNKFEKMNNDF